METLPTLPPTFYAQDIFVCCATQRYAKVTHTAYPRDRPGSHTQTHTPDPYLPDPPLSKRRPRRIMSCHNTIANPSPLPGHRISHQGFWPDPHALPCWWNGTWDFFHPSSLFCLCPTGRQPDRTDRTEQNRHMSLFFYISIRSGSRRSFSVCLCPAIYPPRCSPDDPSARSARYTLVLAASGRSSRWLSVCLPPSPAPPLF